MERPRAQARRVQSRAARSTAAAGRWLSAGAAVASDSLAVLHEKHVELLDVGDCKLVKARGHAVARGLVGAVANFYIFCQPLGPESSTERGRVSYQPRLLRCGRERGLSRGREASRQGERGQATAGLSHRVLAPGGTAARGRAQATAGETRLGTGL